MVHYDIIDIIMRQGCVKKILPQGGEWFISGVLGLGAAVTCTLVMGQYGAPFGFILGIIIMISLGQWLRVYSLPSSYIEEGTERNLVILGAISLIIGILFFLFVSSL